MSQQNAENFMNLVRDRSELRQEIAALGQDMDQVIAVAGREGYSFSRADFEAALKERGYEVGIELSEQELEQVAGGTATVACQSLITQENTFCDQNTCSCPSTDWPDC